jgi:predicted RNA binding protein YcfA (HicA-like mRNA interferase family)
VQALALFGLDIVSKMIYHTCVAARTVISKLQDEGWEILRTKGSHVILGKGSQRTTIAKHGSKDIPIGTLKAIEKQTGVKF